MKTNLLYFLTLALLLALSGCDTTPGGTSGGTTPSGLQATKEDSLLSKQLTGKWYLDSLTLFPAGSVYTQKDLGNNTVSFSAEGKLNISKPDSQNPANQEESVYNFQVAQRLIATPDFEWTLVSVTDERLQVETPTPDGKGNARYVYKRKR